MLEEEVEVLGQVEQQEQVDQVEVVQDLLHQLQQPQEQLTPEVVVEAEDLMVLVHQEVMVDQE
jgi:hypothetical protein